MTSAKNSHDAGPRGGPPAMEYKLPIFDCRLARPALPVSNFQFPQSGKVGGRKKIYEQSHQVIENK
jgi:hypothetical protein